MLKVMPVIFIYVVFVNIMLGNLAFRSKGNTCKFPKFTDCNFCNKCNQISCDFIVLFFFSLIFFRNS